MVKSSVANLNYPETVSPGVDIIEIERIEQVLRRFSESFPRRILTEGELKQYEILPIGSRKRIYYLAKRWAAKEAFSKAVGTGIGSKFSFKDLAIFSQRNQKPMIVLTEQAKLSLQISHVDISWSDEKNYVVAFCITKKNL